MILYEAPHHLIRTLEELYAALGERRITLSSELTKKFETVFPTTLEKALDYYKTEEPRGEYVLVVEGKSPEEKRQEEIASWESMSFQSGGKYGLELLGQFSAQRDPPLPQCRIQFLQCPDQMMGCLTLSGLSTRRFCFEGFLPADKKEKKAILEELKTEKPSCTESRQSQCCNTGRRTRQGSDGNILYQSPGVYMREIYDIYGY